MRVPLKILELYCSGERVGMSRYRWRKRVEREDTELSGGKENVQV